MTGYQYIRYLVQRKPKLGRTKPSIGPQVRHSWCSAFPLILWLYV